MPVFSIILYSHSKDRFFEAVSLAAGETARGKTVLFFLRGKGLKSFVEDSWAPAPETDVEEGMKRFEKISPQEILKEICEKGQVRLYACSAWVRMLDLDSETVARRVDSIVGLHTFLSQADGGPILYI